MRGYHSHTDKKEGSLSCYMQCIDNAVILLSKLYYCSSHNVFTFVNEGDSVVLELFQDMAAFGVP